MAIEFHCKECDKIIVIKYLKPGEQALCRNCGVENIVPADATETDKEPEYNKMPPVFDETPPEKSPTKKHNDLVDIEMPQKTNKPYPGLLQTGQLLFYYIGLTIVLMFFATGIGMIFNAEVHNDRLIATTIASAALILMLLIGLHKTRASSHEVFPFTKFDWKPFALLLVITFGVRCFYSGGVSLLTMFFPQFDQVIQSSIEKVLKIYEMGYIFSFIFVVIVGPVTEELFIRGLVLRGYLQRYGINRAILYSAIIFGIIHVQPAQVIQGIILGYILGWTFVLTKSLIPCILIHAFSNLMSYLGFFILMRGHVDTKESASLEDFIISIILIIVGIIVSIISFRHLRQTYQKNKTVNIIGSNPHA
jgi:membrane protease YdiL (CAAX protease family)